MRRTLVLAIALCWLPGCAALEALYGPSIGVSPPHPVYGTPVYVVPEQQEVTGAKPAAPPLGPGDVPTPAEGTSAALCDAGAPWTIMVIRLEHAKAEELAETLGRILPPGMTVVPDPRTNSLLISATSSPPAEPIAPVND